ncbi:4-hydroxy-tetrahydrodipicolinate reductase [Tuwongella immobilis]|uniref:4-hydroxy-tetrahydrodipicolinate reductase n=1 Tax=Tuwongella immobilis TaxID=692036 RepID=A0A6C2YVW5_9BACT|nr:4-hydroxy-tetrahydrodipicolinate reductase [Tuwongella immobilis]VIP05656.1 dihydrodipicolinate reductase : 4-hydroxy-tetrahydrodipicolinate reductase OS=Planctomyces limnophilus (strain ATCC 43296 / DSM 3776 / IFAM 1008 / 290) GN=dapB PE=3 SV=1: DapB_N: DapB_C [Tuwongella immobilis]VTS08668.1 dihydrodipicolinate reductase : 4-hydroxy-tetrahydrodipicolinate reductase OS=Planctomyces limnophilus (strain ATCC 43296 / DSM 3776 / IFAM 1008 / 290) GN=dapB PE=3 SV=1: DapB_N: DapB_C [Tuwongella immob
MKIAIGFHGAAGRMGQRLVTLAREDAAFRVVAALEGASNPKIGQDAGEVAGIGTIGVPLSHELPLEPKPDVIVDFSVPEGTMELLKVVTARQIPLVVATTGFTAEQKAEILAAAHQTAILFSPNMSLSVNVLFELTRQAAQMLKDKDFDVEIIEKHHRFKKDSPSGTAMQFARIVQEVQGQTELRHGREGLVGERPRTEIGMHAVRVGDNVGEHEILFSTLGETLELVHRGHSRDSYARGALAAAKFLVGKPAGTYSMRDVLGL